jgi:hypothetical protein
MPEGGRDLSWRRARTARGARVRVLWEEEGRLVAFLGTSCFLVSKPRKQRLNAKKQTYCYIYGRRLHSALAHIASRR